MLDPVRPGEPLQAGKQNRLIDAVNRLAGEPRPGDDWPTLILVELTSGVTMPDLGTASAEYVNVEPTPYATAKRCLCWTHAADDAYKSYQADAGNRTITVYFPLCRRNDDGYAVRPPPAQSGDRILVFANPQSGRWEALTGPDLLVPIELKTNLAATGGATAQIIRAQGSNWPTPDTALEITVYPLANQSDLLGWGQAGGYDGLRGWARFVPADGVWYVVNLSRLALLIFFTLAENMAHGAAGADASVTAWYHGEYPAALLDVSSNLPLLNKAGHSGATGNTGLAIFSPADEGYVIVAIEPNDYDPVTLTLVSQVTAAGYYDRLIKFPQGTTFGSESYHAY